MNEAELLYKASRGDANAFCLLIEPYKNPLLNHIFKILKNREDSEDALQEAFIKAYKAVKTFQGDCSFKNWLYKIATNVCYDELRKRKNKTQVSLHGTDEKGDYEIEVADDTYSPEHAAKRTAAAEALQKALLKLPNEQRTAIALRDIDGFSYDDIAQITSSSPGTVKSRINRARLALKKILEKDKELFL